MTRDKFFIQLEEFYKHGIDIIKVKNQDYANNSDPFANFKWAKLLGLPPEMGIMLRVVDKIARIKNLLGKENAVKDETIDDTLLDVCNYFAILAVYLKNNKGNKSSEKDFKTATMLVRVLLEHGVDVMLQIYEQVENKSNIKMQ